jgi:F420-dependent oxidoreductase-like protein
MKLSVLFPESRDVRRVVELAARCDDLGFHGLFLGSAFGFDPIMALAAAGPATSRILLGTAVVPTWPRHPLVMAQQAATANALCGGRFRLGIGPSHAGVMGMYGLPFDRPIGHVKEYVAVLRSLLNDGRVSFAGERYRVKAFLDVEGGGHPPILIAALHEQLCRLAGGVADGVLPWLAPPSYVAATVVPNVRAGAEAAGRSAPPVIIEVPCYLSTDADAVHAAARRDLGIYTHVPIYVDMLVRAGVPDAAEAPAAGWTDAMIDAVVPWGDEEALAGIATAYLEAGADEIVFSPFAVEGDDLDKTLEVLGGIARG